MFYSQSHEKIVEPSQTTQNIPDEENEKEVNDQNDDSDFDDDLWITYSNLFFVLYIYICYSRMTTIWAYGECHAKS